ncbi:MAG TPA: DUF1343 domain-containing protein [Cyclobacteriaceae bacterium]|nr:DUF1343 domain-containing protein [Cyclobacteriaceae bacterium]
MKKLFFLPFALLFVCFHCPEKNNKYGDVGKRLASEAPHVIVGAEQLSLLLPKLNDKRVALVVNNTAVVGKKHLADTLKDLGVNLKKILAPEHGFRGNADAGEHVNDSVDQKLGIPIVSIYGKSRKPSAKQLEDVDIIIFDIQDVGVRFFTYTSTMHYLMEACAENNKKLIILDRPNPNGSYIDGPVLEPEFKSFLGLNPLPLVHGLTVGELAQMINGEGWLEDGKPCALEIIPLRNWKHEDSYSLPIKPSPNLPNDQAIKLYPSLGLFEGVNISVGRGTQMPFQILGHPDFKDMPFQFTPASIEGMSKNPPFQDKVCHGIDLRNVKVEPKVDLSYLIKLYQAFPDKQKFFNSGFNAHAGNAKLKEQIISGTSEDDIRKTWQSDLEKYKIIRRKYLLYE